MRQNKFICFLSRYYKISLPASDNSPPGTKSLRKKSTRKTGGQLGHKGHTLEMKAVPYEFHELKSNYCQNCSQSIGHLNYDLLSKRQVVKLPQIELLVTQKMLLHRFNMTLGTM